MTIILCLLISVCAVALCAAAVNLGRLAAASERAADAIARIDIGAAPAADNASTPTATTRGVGGGGRR